MNFVSYFKDHLICPSCRQKIVIQQENIPRCESCSTEYLQWAGLYTLVPDPDGFISDRKKKIYVELFRLEVTVENIKNELSEENSALAIRRLSLMRDHIREHKKALVRLLRGVGVEDVTQTHVRNSIALFEERNQKVEVRRESLPYYVNLIRDWGWENFGNTENQQAIELIKKISSNKLSGKTLVLGGGSGRLAYDFHREFQAQATVTVDLNPIPSIAGLQIIKGKTVKLIEFPLVPINLESYAIERALRRAGPEVNHFYSIFADVRCLPFSAETFDTIVTPWFIDDVSIDMPTLFKIINGLLKTGGRWIQFGPVGFRNPSYKKIYSKEEVLEAILSSGFKIKSKLHECVDYLNSPVSCHGRKERVLVFEAQKVIAVVAPQIDQGTQLDLEDNAPIKITEEMKAAFVSNQLEMWILSQVDGVISLNGLAKKFSENHPLPYQETKLFLKSFFESLKTQKLI